MLIKDGKDQLSGRAIRNRQDVLDTYAATLSKDKAHLYAGTTVRQL